jgi:hypothetical protein
MSLKYMTEFSGTLTMLAFCWICHWFILLFVVWIHKRSHVPSFRLNSSVNKKRCFASSMFSKPAAVSGYSSFNQLKWNRITAPVKQIQSSFYVRGLHINFFKNHIRYLGNNCMTANTLKISRDYFNFVFLNNCIYSLMKR